MLARHPQAQSLLWTDSRDGDDAIAVAVEQVRFWRKRRLTPAMIYQAFGVRWVPPRGGDAWPSWDDAVWLVAEAWQALPYRRRQDDSVAVGPRGQFALPFPQPAARVAPAESGRQAPSAPGRLPDSHDLPPRGGGGDGPAENIPQNAADSLAADAGRRGRHMSRIRWVHPSQWTDEDFVECSPMARLLLLGLRNEADDQGVFEWRPAQLKMRLLPADAVAIGELLDELVANRQIGHFEAGGRHYGVCLVWGQKPRRPTARYPAPPADFARRSEFTGADFPDNDGSAPDIDRTLPDNDGSAPALESGIRNQEEREQGEGGAGGRGNSAPGGAALSLGDFEDLPDEWREAAAADRVKAGLPEVSLAAEWVKFRNHCAPGTRMPRANWRRRWLGWALNARAASGEPAASPSPETRTGPRPPVAHHLGPAGDRLCAEFGEAAFRAWCTELTAAIDGDTLDLFAPTPATRNFLRQRESEILRAWQPEGVERVEIGLRARPAEAPATPPPASAAPAAAKANGPHSAPPAAKRGREDKRKPSGQRHMLLPVQGQGEKAGAAPVETEPPAARRGAA